MHRTGSFSQKHKQNFDISIDYSVGWIYVGTTVEVWEWISNFIPSFTGHVITYPCWGLNLIHVGERGPSRHGALCVEDSILYKRNWSVWYQSGHEGVIEWKHFTRYWPFVRGIHRSPVNSLHRGQWRGALMFSSICVCINGWVNNREAGDLRCYRAHCDVIVMNRVQT